MRTALALVACIGLTSCTHELDDTSSENAGAAIVEGQRNTGDPSIVMLIIQNDVVGATCTGTVVSPHVIATAAHCVHPELLEEQLGPGVEIYVFLGDDVNDPDQVNDNGNFVFVDQVVWDPAFDPGADLQNAAPGHDVGAVITTTSMKVPPIPLRRGALGPEWVGRDARIVGYGMTEPGDVDSSGTKYQGTVAIAGIDETHVWNDGSGPRLCGGDSGGPTLVTENGVESLAAIHSWIEHLAACTGEAWDMRVDTTLLPLIDPLIAEHDPGFVPPPDGSSLGGGGGDGSTSTTSGGASGDEGGAGGGDGEEDDGCSTSGGTPNGGTALLLLALAAVVRGRRARG